MSAKDLAEHYYAVAADLKRNGLSQLDMAERLARCADALCEHHIREAPTLAADRAMICQCINGVPNDDCPVHSPKACASGTPQGRNDD